MNEALLCECGSARFHLLKNGLIECCNCQKHLNGGNAIWIMSKEKDDEK